ncbi:hypothetical protein F4782DRAFT_525139 [Xylaria castorea]|nr:hypothetical protein F4782DRAFT_525139 [Xylaria castorea]
MYPQANEAPTNWGQVESHSRSATAEQCLDFEIAPEGAVFETSRHEYLTKFRHINCAEYEGLVRPATPRGDNDTPVPEDYSNFAFVEIMPERQGLNNREFVRRMQVCPGGCNEGRECQNGDYDAGGGTAVSSLSDEAIAAILYNRTLALFRVMHPQRAPIIEIVATRVVWSESSPIPAYFSISRSAIMPHSSAVTLAHLALLQARGHVDNIEVDFRTYYSQPNENLDQDTRSGCLARLFPNLTPSKTLRKRNY